MGDPCAPLEIRRGKVGQPGGEVQGVAGLGFWDFWEWNGTISTMRDMGYGMDMEWNVSQKSLNGMEWDYFYIMISSIFIILHGFQSHHPNIKHHGGSYQAS
jgi:hypothetical protein